MDYEQLIQDMIAAKEVAKKAAEAVPQGGTCNHDSCFFYVGGWSPASFTASPDRRVARKSVKFERALATAGVSCFYHATRLSRGYMLTGLCYGDQGYPQTKAAEAVTEFLREKGYPVTVWYQMD